MNKKEQEAIEKINNSYDWNTGWVECEAKTWNIIKNLIDKLQKEVEEKQTIIYAGAEKVKQLQKENEEQFRQLCKLSIKLDMETISKDKIRDFIREYLPDEEIMKSCQIYDTNGILIREKLEELLKGE